MTTAIPSDCKIVHIGEDDIDELDAADAIFRGARIQYGREEEIAIVAVCQRRVVGATTLGSHWTSDWGDEKALEFTFSIVVSSAWQKRDLGRRLVEEAMKEAKSRADGHPYFFRVWVVNPNMARLLESMGFETDGSEWTLDEPHMTYFPRTPGRAAGRVAPKRRAFMTQKSTYVSKKPLTLANDDDLKRAIEVGKKHPYDHLVLLKWKRNSEAQMVLHQLALAIASIRASDYHSALLHYGMGISSVEKGAAPAAKREAYRAYNLIVRRALEDQLARVSKRR